MGIDRSHPATDPLQSQGSPGSRIFLQSSEQRWAGAGGQSSAQLPRAEPMTAPGIIPYPTYHFTSIWGTQFPSHSTRLMTYANSGLLLAPHKHFNGVASPPALSQRAMNDMIWAKALLPPDFPRCHDDSVHAELFHLLIAHYSSYLPPSIIQDPLRMLQMLRERSLLLHSADVVEMPTMFSYAHVVHRCPLLEARGASRRKSTPVFVTRFGVSAPNQTHLGRGLGLANGLAAVVRAYRVRRGWGLLGVNPDAELPPSPTTGWPHGHCAEMQAIPPIVEWCESLGLGEDHYLLPYRCTSQGLGRLRCVVTAVLISLSVYSRDIPHGR
ncbi:hypothetical protein FA13DRAFT_1774423 [Coprinellus micaceus]|uniref:Uncharacterized protein n=1 Tax=Coprinellus micaceus TaxID=71717 RepID=A0A4Y7TD21_COPMI|nr:hypothetical protein FA13DRAFT_1774423 [Coprinellus micaceus]